ncbi:MAG: glycosyltransferase [Bryobacteraceae bacterium]|nr:glycosyltransferase [Bryobacteraceae bacterium]
MPKVSIILPAFNAAVYLSASIRSALAQTLTDFELLILDNASTDNTADVAAQFSDSRIRIIRHPVNYGFGGNVARGLAMAQGQYSAVLGADDVWDSKFLERTIVFLDKHEHCSFVHTDAIWIDAESQPFGESAAQWPKLSRGEDAFVNCFRDGFCFSALVLRSRTLAKAGGFEETWGPAGDLTLFLRLCLYGDAGFLAEPLVWYRHHSANLTSASFTSFSGSMLVLELQALDLALGWPESSRLDRATARKLALHYIAVRTLRMMHLLRIQRQRWNWLRTFFRSVSISPSVVLLPSTWARFGFGLLPRAAILSLQRWKHARNSSRMREVSSVRSVP